MSAQRVKTYVHIWILVLTALAAARVDADTLRVPSQFPNIQAAIDAAVNGDTVLVADGRYSGLGNIGLDFGGKAITVRSEHGPGSTTIDCQRQDRGFIFQNDEPPEAILEGLTISDGLASAESIGGPAGGGILVLTGSPTIRDCHIISCEANNSGGGLYADTGASPTVRNCTIADNTASNGGGGLLLRGGEAAIAGCTITRNQTTFGSGGGILIIEGQPTLRNCSITDNTAAGRGGGMSASSRRAELSIEDCRIAGNVSGSFGGGVSLWWASTIANCVIEGNEALYGGGGVSCALGVTIRNCTIRGNVASGKGAAGAGIYAWWRFTTIVDSCVISDNWILQDGIGAGVFCDSSASIIRNCTIVRNRTSKGSGGGLAYSGTGQHTLANCTVAANSAMSFGGGVLGAEWGAVLVNDSIIWDNSAAEGGQLALLDSSTVDVFYSDVRGGPAAIHIAPNAVLSWAVGNIVTPPQFVSSPLNFHLRLDSPCIDAGDPAALHAGQADIDGELRVWNGRVDMGSDEFGSFRFGDLNCDGRADGGDIDAFFLALGDPAGYSVVFPGCDILLGDMNGDGRVDGADIDPFFACLGGGPCP
ncbi:MAG: right-handed parallel beta-helix repeat-containing protein [Planctomycetes bacterium]|nr:right-handed parallel beta-helix repeat-containing protein [Planctomycetota bacterium]